MCARVDSFPVLENCRAKDMRAAHLPAAAATVREELPTSCANPSRALCQVPPSPWSIEAEDGRDSSPPPEDSALILPTPASISPAICLPLRPFPCLDRAFGAVFSRCLRSSAVPISVLILFFGVGRRRQERSRACFIQPSPRRSWLLRLTRDKYHYRRRSMDRLLANICARRSESVRAATRPADRLHRASAA